MNTFYFAYTDLFGGELNYSFVRRYCVKAKTEKGAARLLARYLGINYRYDEGLKLYKSKSNLSAFYTEESDDIDEIFPLEFEIIN